MSLIYAPIGNTAKIGSFVNSLQFQRERRGLVEYTKQRPESDPLIHGAYLGNDPHLHCNLTVRSTTAYINTNGTEDFPFHAQLVNPSLELTTHMSPDLLKTLHTALLENTKIISLFGTSDGLVLALRLIGTDAREIYSAADEATYSLFGLSATLLKMSAKLDSVKINLTDDEYYNKLLQLVCDDKFKNGIRTAQPENAFTEL